MSLLAEGAKDSDPEPVGLRTVLLAILGDWRRTSWTGPLLSIAERRTAGVVWTTCKGQGP